MDRGMEAEHYSVSLFSTAVAAAGDESGGGRGERAGANGGGSYFMEGDGAQEEADFDVPDYYYAANPSLAADSQTPAQTGSLEGRPRSSTSPTPARSTELYHPSPASSASASYSHFSPYFSSSALAPPASAPLPAIDPRTDRGVHYRQSSERQYYERWGGESARSLRSPYHPQFAGDVHHQTHAPTQHSHSLQNEYYRQQPCTNDLTVANETSAAAQVPHSASTTASRHQRAASSRLYEEDGNQSGYSHDRRKHPFRFPSGSASVGSSPRTSPPLTSSYNMNSNKAVPRTSSIDSAISTVSGQSTSMGHQSTPSSATNNILSNITGSSPADIQNLIQAAGSAEDLIRYMLKDKQSLTAQNAQLWRLVDKQRAMILGLNKDLERALKDKERYRKKLKEQLGMVPPLPTGSSSATFTPGRSVSESPVPSIDVDDGKPDRGASSPSETSSIARSESVPLVGRDLHTSPTSTLDIHGATFPNTPSPPGPRYILASGNGKASRQVNGANDEPSGLHVNGTTMLDTLHTPSPPPTSTVPPPHDVHDRVATDDDNVPRTPPLSVVTNMSELSHESPLAPRPMTAARKLGLSTNIPSAGGLGKSPIRKAPPAPLELSPQREKPEFPLNNIKEVTESDLCETSGHQAESAGSWQATPEDKKAPTPRILPDENRMEVPPPQPAPVPEVGTMPTSNQTEPKEEAPLSPRIRQQFARNGLTSPGLPSSPRPSDRPMNSPRPRNRESKIMESVPGSPPHSAVVAPRTSLPAQSSAPNPMDRDRSGSLGSLPSYSQQKIPDRGELMFHPSAISSIDARVVSSRMRPSRMSMLPGKAGSGDSVLTLGVFSRVDNKEIVRVEKDVASLTALDNKLRKLISYGVSVPDRSIFSGHAPARVDARRVAIDTYFTGVLGATMDERAALALCEFFSCDVVERSPQGLDSSSMKSSPKDSDGPIGSTVVREGYLTKRGKNFGGWKERYFVLDGPVLKYFDGPGGAQLGQIKLQHAQIGRQSSSQKNKEDGIVDEETEYRHAFLVLEPKRKDSTTLVRHVLCAESDAERDEWVSALLMFVDKQESNDKGDKKGRHTLRAKEGSVEGKTSEDSQLRSVAYQEANPGPAPARGPTPDELGRNSVSPSPSSHMSQPPAQFSSHAPVPERGPIAKQISAPQGGSVISDLAAWGASKLGPSPQPTEKALKKRSIWGFRQRSSDLDHQTEESYQTGQQAAAQKFPLPRTVFGASLEEAVYLTRPPGTEIALPAVVYRCIEYLDANNASEEEGIFRLSGSNVVIKGLKERFNTESDFNLLGNDEYYDVHAIAGLLKLYLRELPTNVLTTARREDFVKVTELQGDKSNKIRALNDLVHSLPIENFTLLKALSGHLLRIVDNADINKMTIRNVGIVFSPTLNIPAQVFSMFLHEYHEIFFRDADGRPQSPVAVKQSFEQPMGTPSRATFQPQLSDPPRTPGFGTHPPSTPHTPMSARHPPPPQFTSYEPVYEQRPAASTPNTPRFSEFQQDPSNGAGIGGGLSVPGQDAKVQKSRRRESSMMFMMGKKSPMFPPANRSEATSLVVEDSVYD